jgi:hypothetical protein
MTSLLHQLENNDAILLMYLADELSAEDRAEVEQMLASDAQMRAALDQLRSAHDDTVAAMAKGDAVARLPVSAGVAVRRVTRAMRQWQTDQFTHEPEPEPTNELRFPWWSYPLTTAAAVLIAFLVWWGNRSERPQVAGPGTYEEYPVGPRDVVEWKEELAGDYLEESIDPFEEEFAKMVINQPVDEALARLEAMSKRPDDMDLIFMNVTERNW